MKKMCYLLLVVMAGFLMFMLVYFPQGGCLAQAAVVTVPVLDDAPECISCDDTSHCEPGYHDAWDTYGPFYGP